MDFTEFESNLEYAKYYSDKYISLVLAKEDYSFKPLFVSTEPKLGHIYARYAVDIPSSITFARGIDENGFGVLYNNLIIENNIEQGIILIVAPLKHIINVELRNKYYA